VTSCWRLDFGKLQVAFRSQKHNFLRIFLCPSSCVSTARAPLNVCFEIYGHFVMILSATLPLSITSTLP